MLGRLRMCMCDLNVKGQIKHADFVVRLATWSVQGRIASVIYLFIYLLIINLIIL